MNIVGMCSLACAPAMLLLMLGPPAGAAETVFLAVDQNLFEDSRFTGWRMDRSILVSDGSCIGEYEREGRWVSVDLPCAPDDVRQAVAFVREHQIDPTAIAQADVPRYLRIQVHITTADYTDHGLYLIATDADLPELIKRVRLSAVAKR